MSDLLYRVSRRWRRFAIEHFARRTWQLGTTHSYISFTFDDFPRSALRLGGQILSDHGVRGTYFVSCDLLESTGPSGPIASGEDLRYLVQAEHELGCHTFEQLDGASSVPSEYERSIATNRAALARHGVTAAFDVFSYPLNGPTLAVKRIVGRHFSACRWGGQTSNHGSVDLNLLRAYFLDKRSRGHLSDVTRLIERNARERGWLIFATHDVAEEPSEYGCSSDDFATIVRMAVESGSRVLPMGGVCRELGVAARR